MSFPVTIPIAFIYRRVLKTSKAQTGLESRIIFSTPEDDNKTSDVEAVKLVIRTKCSELTLKFGE